MKQKDILLKRYFEEKFGEVFYPQSYNHWVKIIDSLSEKQTKEALKALIDLPSLAKGLEAAIAVQVNNER